MTSEPGRAAWLRQARSHLRNADPVLARLIDERPDFDPRAWLAQLPPMDLYGALLFQVTGAPRRYSAPDPANPVSGSAGCSWRGQLGIGEHNLPGCRRGVRADAACPSLNPWNRPGSCS